MITNALLECLNVLLSICYPTRILFEMHHTMMTCLISRSYWEGVPDIYKSRLHYYNEPITSAITAPDHPISIIRTIYRPGDFIALKLDIDNSSLETAFVDAIANDEDLLRSIGEMFFEQHYDHEGNIACHLNNI